MSEPTCVVADTIGRLVELGVTITDAAITEHATIIDCRPVETDPACPSCGRDGTLRDHVDRMLTDLPIAGHPSRLRVRVPRLTCANTECATNVYRGRIDRVAEQRAGTTRRCARWILQRLVIDTMSVSAVARLLGLSWATVNTLALETVRNVVLADPYRLDTVRYLGACEHKWKHVRGDGSPSYVTVIVDLTPVIDGTGPARLLDMRPGRSGKVVETWLDQQDPNFRRRIHVVSLDGFAGYHTAAASALLQARTVMDPFHVVHLAAGKLTVCRQRVQQETRGHRGRAGDPLYTIRRIMLTRMGLLTERQARRLGAVLADERHEPIEAFYLVYQDLIDAYENPDRRAGKLAMFRLLKAIRTGVPKGLAELTSLGRSLWKRRREILAYFDVGVSNGPSKRSTADSNIYAASAWASGTSSTTSCGRSSTPDRSRQPSTHSRFRRASYLQDQHRRKAA